MMASNDNGGRGARGRAAEVYQQARDKTASAYETARDRASDVTRQAGEQLAVYPVAAVIGSFAVGALLGALLPRTDREEKLLGTTGRKLNEAAREAARRGVDAGRDQFEEIRDKAVKKVSDAVADLAGSKS